MRKGIPIFFSFNNNYVIPACVALYSLLNKAKENITYKMYVLHSDITIENQNLLNSIINKFDNSTLEFINTEGFLANEWRNGNWAGHNKKSQFTLETIVKCFASRFFPQYDKIIYSDVDCVFVDDISDLLDINLDGKYIGAVKDAFMKYIPTELSHLDETYYEKLKDQYFCGGIWVLNLKQIREDNLEAIIVDNINNDKITKQWPDQDIMNIACLNKVEYLPLNYISYPYLIDYLIKPDFVSGFSKDELYDSILNPKIIHYAAVKPWKQETRYDDIWWAIFYYLNLPKTSIIERGIDNDKEGNKLKKYKILFNTFLVISIILMIIVIFIALKYYGVNIL